MHRLAIAPVRRMTRSVLPLQASLPLALGLLLRLWFVHHNPDLSGDPLLYGAIARNLLEHGVYGFTAGVPTLIRLPGYPLFLAACFRVFGLSSGVEHYYPVLYLQVAFDLLGCWALARLAARLAPAPLQTRAARATLWLAALCPFTACYTAAPLTETLELLSISTALLCFARALGIGNATSPASKSRVTLSSSQPSVVSSVLQASVVSSSSQAGVTSSSPQLSDTSSAPQPSVTLSGVPEENVVEGPAFLPSMQAWWFVASALAWIAAALLRPDGALLGVVLCPAFVLYSGRSWKHALRPAALSALISLLAFVPWTLRNWHTFHVFEPLAPRYATDPGESVNPGFQRWTKTVCVDLACTSEVYWAANDDPISLDELPSRAFDSGEQLRATADLLADYNRGTTVTPAIDARFGALANQRIADHPLRYYVTLPLLRLADMWFRPRVELFNIDLRWWRYGPEGPDTILAWGYAVLNVLYLALAVVGAMRRPPLLGVLTAFILLRCALLWTIEAPEPRYTLECFPMVFVLGGIALAGWRRSTTSM